MIKGTVIKPMYTIQRSEVNYRKLDALNCSMLKLFDSDPVKFFEQFKLGKKRKDKNTTSIIIGDMVDFYLLECKGNEQEFEQRFDEKFALYTGGNKGTKQVYVLADVLFEITKDCLDDDNKPTLTFDARFKDAFSKVQTLGKFNGKTEEEALEIFNKDGYVYFENLLENIGKVVVDASLIDKAKRVAKILVEDGFTKHIFEENEHVEYYPKFPIEWKYKNVECKSEVDILKVNHEDKIIQVMDLKTTYDNENFEFGYLKHRYYLQAAFYTLAAKYWAQSEGMGDYIVAPVEFVVGDTSGNNRRPIIYRLTPDDIKAGLDGFYLRGVKYKGIHELMEDILWAEQNNTWNCSRELNDMDGILKLNLKYD